MALALSEGVPYDRLLGPTSVSVKLKDHYMGTCVSAAIFVASARTTLRFSTVCPSL